MVLPVAVPVEAPRHEVRAAVLTQQAAGLHRYPGSLGHEMVGVFYAAVVPGCAECMVLADAVELEKPVLEALRDIKLPASYLLGPGIPGDHRLGTGASGGGAHPD